MRTRSETAVCEPGYPTKSPYRDEHSTLGNGKVNCGQIAPPSEMSLIDKTIIQLNDQYEQLVVIDRNLNKIFGEIFVRYEDDKAFDNELIYGEEPLEVILSKSYDRNYRYINNIGYTIRQLMEKL